MDKKTPTTRTPRLFWFQRWGHRHYGACIPVVVVGVNAWLVTAMSLHGLHSDKTQSQAVDDTVIGGGWEYPGHNQEWGFCDE